MTRKLFCGVGINDANYETHECPYYKRWAQMLSRCYSKKYQERKPTYIGCTVCKEWLTFSNFKAWMEGEDWAGKSIDKDLLFFNNKIYSEKTCIFIDSLINTFLCSSDASRGCLPIGVSVHKEAGKFRSNCSNPLTKKVEYLGLFTCPEKAHLAWKKRKHEIACQLAELQSDKRVANALRVRYLQP